MISEYPEEKTYKGFINNDIISYLEDDKTKVEVDLNKKIITRDNDEKLLVIDYRRQVIHITLKEYNYSLDMNVSNVEDKYKDNCFSLKYELEKKIIEYILEYEEI